MELKQSLTSLQGELLVPVSGTGHGHCPNPGIPDGGHWCKLSHLPREAWPLILLPAASGTPASAGVGAAIAPVPHAMSAGGGSGEGAPGPSSRAVGVLEGRRVRSRAWLLAGPCLPAGWHGARQQK